VILLMMSNGQFWMVYNGVRMTDRVLIREPKSGIGLLYKHTRR